MRNLLASLVLFFVVFGGLTAQAGEVLIYTGTVQWISKGAADEQGQICSDTLSCIGIENQLLQSSADMDAVFDWVDSVTDNGELDVLVLYGDFPPTIYPDGNAMPDDSPAELFLESEDGDAIVNHADYMFWGLGNRNGVGGLENMMDIPGIVMWDDNTPMTVTDDGRDISPTLQDFMTDRPMHIDQLQGDWEVEVTLAESASGLRADPIIVRDGDRGRLIPILQTANNDSEPKGAIAAEIIAWLYENDNVCGNPSLRVSGTQVSLTDGVVNLTVKSVNEAGGDLPAAADVTVTLASDSATGVFDTAADGAFDGSVTTVTIAAGALAAPVYYKDSSAGMHTISATADGYNEGELQVNYLAKVPNKPQGEVLIYTGTTQWITKASADTQAQITVDLLEDAGIANQWLQSDIDMEDVALWVEDATDNGKLDVLVLYGDFPPTIYPDGNAMPEDSPAELFIETEDGDAIINHADYMFWGLGNRNGVGGLENMMDIPGIVMWDDNTPMTVTDDGKRIAPSLTDFQTDRPVHIDQLAGNWHVEVSLAQNAAGTRADPIVIRDGNLGRLIPVLQTANNEDEPKGAIAGEIIIWLMEQSLPAPTQVGFSGAGAVNAGTATRVTVELQDSGGIRRPAQSDVTVNLATDTGTGAFDTAADGAFDGSVTSIVIPKDSATGDVYYKDTAGGTATLTGSADGLDAGEFVLTIIPPPTVSRGEVAIYSGTVQWISKAAADEQAQICANLLEDAGVSNIWYQSDVDMEDLAAWVDGATDNGQFDVLVLYGDFPPTLYPDGNAEPDDTIGERFIESKDGDAIINHADYMFWGLGNRNGVGGLENMMDIPGIVMWDDNTPMTVTAEGAEISPTLTDFQTDRPMHIDQLAGNWTVEVSLAQNASGSRADPIIVRDGDGGRLIPVLQTANNDTEPKGTIAAEIITWMMDNFTQSETGGPRFIRGDHNSDASVNIADPVAILNALFSGGDAASCQKTSDANDDGTVNIADAVQVLNGLFSGGGPPMPPYPDCGVDPTDDGLSCDSYPPCE